LFDFLRKLERSPFLWAVYGLIIATFVGGYMPCVGQAGPEGGSNEPYVRVAGETIGYTDLTLGREFSVTQDWLDQLTNKDFSQYLSQVGAGRSARFLRLGTQENLVGVLNSFSGLRSPIDTDPLQAFNAPRDARSALEIKRILDDLIEGYLVADLALQIGLDVSSEDLANRIMGSYRFSDNDGKFDKARFDAFSNLQTGLEAFVRREILRERVIDLMRSMVAVAPAEVRFFADGAGTKVNLEVVEIRSSTLANAIAPTLNDDEVSSYLEENQEAVKAFYDAEENTNRFGQVEKVPFSGMFFAATAVEGDDGATAKARGDARKRAKDALKAAKAKGREKDEEGNKLDPRAAFRSVAGELSEHEESKGSSGVFEGQSAEQLAAAPFGGDLAEAAFAARVGRASKAIKGSDGYWLIFPEEHSEPSPTFEVAKSGIARELLANDRGTEGFDAVIAELITLAKESPEMSLTEVVVAWRGKRGFAPDVSAFPVRETGDFTQLPEGGGPVAPTGLGEVPKVGTSREMVEAAFQLNEENLVPDRAFQPDGSDARFVIRLKSRTELGAEERTALETSIRARLELLRAAQSYRSLVQTLVRKAERDQRLERTSTYRQLIAQAVKELESKKARATP
jgi:hypothetical protein